MPYGKSFRTGLDSGWVIHCAERFVQHWRAGDGLQPTLRCGFRPRLTPGVRCCACSCEGRKVYWPVYLVSY